MRDEYGYVFITFVFRFFLTRITDLPTGTKANIVEVKRAALADPAYAPENMTEELKQELLDDIIELCHMKSVSVRPNNHSAAKAADARVKAMARDVHPHLPYIFPSLNSDTLVYTATEHG